MHKRLIGKRPLHGLMRLRAVLKEQWSRGVEAVTFGPWKSGVKLFGGKFSM